MRRLVTFGIAAAAGYSAARALLDRELPADAPPPIRARLEEAREQLRYAREQTREVLAAVRQATDEATRDLMADYHRRAGRPAPSATPRTSWRR